MTRRKLPMDLKPAAPAALPVAPPSVAAPDAPPPAAATPEEAKSLLLAHISHGFRTPLNAIIGFSEIMEREMFGKIGIPRYIEYVHDIRASAQHLLRLIEDVVDLSKAQGGALELDESEIDVAAAIRSVCLMQREKSAQAGVQIVQEVPDGIPNVLGDRRRLRQILQNLVSNAVRQTSRGGTVTVSASLDRGSIAFVIADTGKGMDAAEIPRAFDPFAGLGRLQDAGGGGTGLGLPLCKGLMELHGGTIALESLPGKGSTVTATFPPSRTVKAKPADK